MNRILIGRVAVGDKEGFEIRVSSSDGFFDRDGSWSGITGGIEVIGGNFQFFGRNKEESEVVFTVDFDIGFVTSLDVVSSAFECGVKLVAMIGSHFTIIKYGLIRETDFKYFPE